MQRPQTEENGALEEPKEIQSRIGKAHSQSMWTRGWIWERMEKRDQ